VTLTRSQRLAIFVAIAFGGSWTLALVFGSTGLPLSPPAARALGVLYVFPPAMAVLVVHGALAKLPLVEPLGLRPRLNRWVLVAWLLPLAILLVAFAIHALWPGLDVITDQDGFIEHLRQTAPPEERARLEERLAEAAPPPPWRLLLHGVFGGVPFILLGFGEELAWRGFLVAEVRGGFWRRSFVSGLAWGAWLLPLAAWIGFYYPAHPEWGVVLVFGYTLVLSPALVLVRARSGTLWAPALMRSTLISLGRPALDLTLGGDDRTAPFMGLTGIAAAALVVGSLVFVSRARSAPGPKTRLSHPAGD
jgi:uncharacterized protein